MKSYAELWQRHCEERKRRSNPYFLCCEMDCFRLRSLSYGGQVAEPVIGRRFAPTRWLAMTVPNFWLFEN
jgi:hypothetical protein